MDQISKFKVLNEYTAIVDGKVVPDLPDYEEPVVLELGVVKTEDGSLRCTPTVYCSVPVSFCALSQQYLACDLHGCKNDAVLFCNAACVHQFAS